MIFSDWEVEIETIFDEGGVHCCLLIIISYRFVAVRAIYLRPIYITSNRETKTDEV